MARNETFFLYADRGETSVFKFRFEDDPDFYVWFEYGGSGGSLHTTPRGGPYRVDDPLQPAGAADLDELLAQKGTTKSQWVADLMAQFGEPLAWSYP